MTKTTVEKRKENELKVVTPIVLDIQAGNEDKWLDLMESLSDYKDIILKKYRASLARYATEADIEAVFDDTLIYAVRNFDISRIDNFVSYFYNILKQNIPQLKRDSLRHKRSLNINAESGDALIQSATGETETLYDKVEDGSDKYEEVESTMSLSSTLMEYAGQTSSSKLNAEIILASAMVDVDDTEKREDVILAVLPEGTSWATARKRLQRAREDFKQYLSDKNK